MLKAQVPHGVAESSAATQAAELRQLPVEVTELRSRRQTTGWLLDQQAEMLALLLDLQALPRMDGPVVLRLPAAPRHAGDLGAALVEHAELLGEGMCLVRMRLSVPAGTAACGS